MLHRFMLCGYNVKRLLKNVETERWENLPQPFERFNTMQQLEFERMIRKENGKFREGEKHFRYMHEKFVSFHKSCFYKGKTKLKSLVAQILPRRARQLLLFNEEEALLSSSLSAMPMSRGEVGWLVLFSNIYFFILAAIFRLRVWLDTNVPFVQNIFGPIRRSPNSAMFVNSITG